MLEVERHFSRGVVIFQSRPGAVVIGLFRRTDEAKGLWALVGLKRKAASLTTGLGNKGKPGSLIRFDAARPT